MSRDRKLKPEERILWGKVARSTRPMSGRLAELAQFDDFVAAEMPAAASAGKNMTPAHDRTAAVGGCTEDGAGENASAVSRSPTGLHHPLEKPVKRKLARGRLKLEARIDLHGMIQSEAHGMLLDFLIHAHERGLRHVLVITGKGSSMGSEGALKRAVPLWFAKPEFRYLISSHETAAQHHGGEGALYIRLSRGRGDER